MSGSPFASMEPPASDRSLDLPRVRRVLEAQFPDLPLDPVEYLGSGWEHDVYLAGRAFVFRFPRYADVARNLDHDRAVHGLVHRAVAGAFRVPEITLFGTGCDGFPHRFVGHAFVPGIGADRASAPRSAALASDLGRALTHVHAIPFAAATSVGVRPADDDCHGPLAALMRQVPLVPALRDLAPGPMDWLLAPPAVPRAAPGPGRFIHNGLHGEHILVDPDAGRLSGIVDWSSATLGDPAIDFSFLLLLGGTGFLEAALASYGLETDPGLRDRIAFRARIRALGWLADAVRRNADTTESRGQVDHAFSAR